MGLQAHAQFWLGKQADITIEIKACLIGRTSKSTSIAHTGLTAIQSQT